jgi:hypothetical protein
MFDSRSQRIPPVSSISAALLAIALLLPRPVQQMDSALLNAHFDPPALLLLAFASALAIYALVCTVRQYSRLPVSTRVIGVAPLVLLVLSLATLYVQ